MIEGLGTGLGGPPILQTALRGVLSADRGSTAGAARAAAGVAASVDGYPVATARGVVILLAASVPIVVLIDVSRPVRRSWEPCLLSI